MTAATAPTRLTPACAGAWGLFDRAADGDAEAVASALDVCSACPVATRAQCLADGLAARDRYAVLGGTTPEDRAALEAATWLIEPPTTRVASRACYADGCDHADCRELNAAYVDASRRVTAVQTIAMPHKPNARNRRCEGQEAMEVSE